MEKKSKYKQVILWLILYPLAILFFIKVTNLLCGDPNCNDWEMYPGDRVAGCESLCIGQVSLP